MDKYIFLYQYYVIMHFSYMYLYINNGKHGIETREFFPVYPYIYFACLSVCFSVRLCPLNVKTAEPFGEKFGVGSHMTPGKVYGCQQNLAIC